MAQDPLTSFYNAIYQFGNTRDARVGTIMNSHQSWVVDMARKAKNKQYRDEAELVVSAMIRNHCRPHGMTGRIRRMIAEQVDQCARCGGVLIDPEFSSEEE